MAGMQSVWGIDIGRSALKAVKLRLSPEGQIELVAHDFVEHAKILSQPDADREELITNSLEKFLSRNDISTAGRSDIESRHSRIRCDQFDQGGHRFRIHEVAAPRPLNHGRRVQLR